MKLMPIRYCADVAAATRFYRALGLDLGAASRPGAWVELPATSGMLALHVGGFSPDPIIDEAFGRSVQVADPDGVWVQVNEHDRELYT